MGHHQKPATGDKASKRPFRFGEQTKKELASFSKGRREIVSNHDAKLFFTAICLEKSVYKRLENIVAHPSGLETIRSYVCASASAEEIREYVLPLISCMGGHEPEAMYEGRVQQQIYGAVVNPPGTWKTMLKLWIDVGLSNQEYKVRTFAYMCLQIVGSRRPELATAANDIRAALKERHFSKDESPCVRSLGDSIQKVLNTQSVDIFTNLDPDTGAPGGRHDNDFADFRAISIFPTARELGSSRVPFYRRAEEIWKLDPDRRMAGHLDNQFRLLREDMLSEIRDDVGIALCCKRTKRPFRVLEDLVVEGVGTGDEARPRFCSVLVRVGSGLGRLRNMPAEQRRKYLTENPDILRSQTLGVLFCQNQVVEVATLVRDIDNLLKDPPVVGLKFPNGQAMMRGFSALYSPYSLRFVLLDTQVSAYEPIFEKLKKITEFALDTQLLRLSSDSDCDVDDCTSQRHKQLLETLTPHRNGKSVKIAIEVDGKQFKVDDAQLKAITSTIKKPLSIVQGPSGTGKTFIAMLAARAWLGDPSLRLLIMSHTDHALDELLATLMWAGLDSDMMIRLGSNSSPETAEMSFKTTFKMCGKQRSKEANSRLYNLKATLSYLRRNMDAAISQANELPRELILKHLEASSDAKERDIWQAFQVFSKKNEHAGAKSPRGRTSPEYLLKIWSQQEKPNDALIRSIPPEAQWVWEISFADRKERMENWVTTLRAARIRFVRTQMDKYNMLQSEVEALLKEPKCTLVRSKRIIACTAADALMYPTLVNAAHPDLVIVEEAGQISESQILSVLGTRTQRLLLLGDDEQLRPKCNNSALSVEQGSGYDFNRSLFERLILQGHAHTVLSKDYRTTSEISQVARALANPNLEGGVKKTESFQVRGIHGALSFVNHGHPEEADIDIFDRYDGGIGVSSKRNPFEAEMVARLVKYLVQQGHETDEMLVLTPHLGQLRLLRDLLGKEYEPVLGVLDSHELTRFGRMTEVAGDVNKTKIRISTIDNYRGANAGIVIASLVRSNEQGDVGFMETGERLKALLCKPIHGLIIFGNMATFTTQGKDFWLHFSDSTQKGGYLKDGLEVHCEQHPESKATLSSPEDFDLECPDGGCTMICGVQLDCGKHTCQRRCHGRSDHVGIPCHQPIEKTCGKGHRYKVKCDKSSVKCTACQNGARDKASSVKQGS